VIGIAWQIEVGDVHPVGHLQQRAAAGVGRGHGWGEGGWKGTIVAFEGGKRSSASTNKKVKGKRGQRGGRERSKQNYAGRGREGKE